MCDAGVDAQNNLGPDGLAPPPQPLPAGEGLWAQIAVSTDFKFRTGFRNNVLQRSISASGLRRRLLP